MKLSWTGRAARILRGGASLQVCDAEGSGLVGVLRDEAHAALQLKLLGTKPGDVLLLPRGRGKSAHLEGVLVLPGKAAANEARLAGAQLRRALPAGIKSVQVRWGKDHSADLAAEFALGFRLGASPAAKGGDRCPALTVEGASPAGKAAFARATILAEAVLLAREIGNLPGNLCSPVELARRGIAAMRSAGGRGRALDERALKKLGMGALLGVAQGSSLPPRLLVMEHGKAARGRPTVVLVGKGVTFDSGGISIKPADGMEKMRHDKCGAAAVIGAMHAVTRLGLSLHVVGLVPAVENMPGGRAQRPGDVVRAMNGRTIEVINTDAEGRLILADALSYAVRMKPQHIVDLATLTGAATIALGKAHAAMLGTDEDTIAHLARLGAVHGEPVWRLPLGSFTAELMQGKISDLKNLGGREAGTITGAEFLKPFVGDVPWTHLDIAAVAWDDTCRAWNRPSGASGFGVRLLVHWLEELAAKPRGRRRKGR